MVAVAQVAERRAVAAKVAGSKPVGHPNAEEGARNRAPSSCVSASLSVAGNALHHKGSRALRAFTCAFRLKLNWSQNLAGRRDGRGGLSL